MINRIEYIAAVVVVLGSVLGTTVLAAQDGPGDARELSVVEIARRAPEWNLSVQRAAHTLRTAQENLDATPGWHASVLNLSGDYQSGQSTPWEFGSSIRAEPYSQLALQAGVTTDITDTGEISSREFASVEVSPFTAPRTSWAQDRDYQVAVVRFNEAHRSTARSAEAAALEILVRRQERALAEETLQLRNREYEVETRRQELGEASFQDVQDRQIALIEARQETFAAQQRELQSETDLARVVALADTPLQVTPLSVTELRDVVQRRLTRVERHQDASPITAALLLAEAELAAQERELRTTRAWRPDLSLTAGVSFPPDRNRPTASGGIQLRLSPGQNEANLEQRRREELELQRLEVAAQRSTAELERDLTMQSLTLERQALEAAELQLQRDRNAEEEAMLLVQQGRRTELQLEQLKLNRRRSEIDTFQSAVQVYLTAGEYLDLVDASDAK